MTAALTLAVALTPVLAVLVAVWVQGRLAVAEVRRVELEAFRASLGLPADRFRIVDEGLVAGWLTRRAVPPFTTAHTLSRPVVRADVGVLR